MLSTQAVSYRIDQAQTDGLYASLLTLRNQLGGDSEDIISDDRLHTMLQITKGDVSEARLMALGYILQTLKLQAQHKEGDAAQNAELTQRFSAMLHTARTQRAPRPVDLKVKSRGSLFQFLIKRS